MIFLEDKVDLLNTIVLFAILIMNINDESVLESLNKLIAIKRLNERQILQMVNLVSLSIDINDLKENLKWESPKTFN